MGQKLHILITDAYGQVISLRLRIAFMIFLTPKLPRFTGLQKHLLYWVTHLRIGRCGTGKATYESVLDGYEPTGDADDVREQVKIRLDKLK